MAVADDTVVGGPIAIAVRGCRIHALHREIARRTRAGRPGAAIAVRRINQVAVWVAQKERGAAVEQITGIDAVGRDIADRAVVGAFEEVITAAGQDASQGDGDAAIA